MNVKAILEDKGRAVETIGPNEALAVAINRLAEHRIGALVVTNGDRKVVGIVSERDVVCALDKHGAAALEQSVRHAMTANVKLCTENHTINQVMEIMTTGRFRHLPVVKNGQLDGIVSIGDVVKHKMSQLEFERDQLDSYVHQT